MKRIAIIGGIGSGKSVVSRLLSLMGYPVYDCDSNAKRLMDESEDIHRGLVDIFGPPAVTPEGINRAYIASIAFKDAEKLSKLNSLVHPAVLHDFDRWAQQNGEIVFVETAILSESGMSKSVDAVWSVEAPLECRVERVMVRNAMSRQDVMRRISSQATTIPDEITSVTHLINDDSHALIPQIVAAIQREHQE